MAGEAEAAVETLHERNEFGRYAVCIGSCWVSSCVWRQPPRRFGRSIQRLIPRGMRQYFDPGFVAREINPIGQALKGDLMKYTLKLTIDSPRENVCKLFGNPQNWSKWQGTFVGYESISGDAGYAGSKTKLIHKFGKRQTEMVETVEANNLPEEMVCIYEAPSAWNRVVYRFKEISPQETELEFESEFKCSGFLKILAFLMPGMFKRASQKDMNAFKKFVETNG
ncbi:MAG: SRPBCC family protein [Rhodocyclaceae bacterium]|nr:SRPBCC family protein [Rhodocyclaceae bacterium]